MTLHSSHLRALPPQWGASLGQELIAARFHGRRLFFSGLQNDNFPMIRRQTHEFHRHAPTSADDNVGPVMRQLNLRPCRKYNSISILTARPSDKASVLQNMPRIGGSRLPRVKFNAAVSGPATRIFGEPIIGLCRRQAQRQVYVQGSKCPKPSDGKSCGKAL